MADKIVAEYTVKVDQALKDLNKLASRVDKVDDERKKVQDGFKDMSKGMAADFKKVGAAIGLAFGVDQLVSFGKEAVKVAAQAEGIRTAFARLNQPNLLNELRKATRGAVDDITLMRQAIRAQNFKVPLEQLGTFFEFATKRSIQTGESVDYLVNSIIDGIGRKSTLVLDNLGISATELQEEMKRTGDFGAAAGAIIARELEKAGDVADTTAIRISQIQTALENIKLAIGEELIGEIDRLSDDFSGLAEQIERLFDADSAEVWAKALQFGLRSLTTGFRVAGGVIERVLLIVNGVKDGVEELYNMARKDLAEAGFIEEIEEKSERANRNVKGLSAAIASVYNLMKNGSGEAVQYVNTLNSLNKELQELQTKFKDIEIGSDAWYNQLEKIRIKTQEVEDATTLMNATLKGVGVNDPIDFDEEDIDGAAESIKNLTDLYLKLYPDEVQRSTDIADKIYERHFNHLMALQDEAFNNDVNNRQENLQLATTLLQSYLQLYSTFTRMAANMTQQQYNYELSLLNERLNNEEISREDYERRRAQMARDNFRKQKEFSIVQAIINTALGVTNAFATAPNIILGAVLAGTVAAVGAAEIATISSQPVPKFAEGGFVMEHGEIKGRSHKHGGVHIEAEGGEFITSAKHAKQNADILKAINSGQWEKYKMENIIAPAINQVLEGGFENMGASYTLNTGWTDKNLLRQGDRNRYAMRDGFIYLGDRMEKALTRKSKNRYV